MRFKYINIYTGVIHEFAELARNRCALEATRTQGFSEERHYATP
jgi:hypothetical protein